MLNLLKRIATRGGEFVGVTVVEAPKVVLYGTKGLGIGLEVTGRTIKTASDSGIKNLGHVQDRIEQIADGICGVTEEEAEELEILKQELKNWDKAKAPADAIPVNDKAKSEVKKAEAKKAKAEKTSYKCDCGKACKSPAGLGAHKARCKKVNPEPKTPVAATPAVAAV